MSLGLPGLLVLVPALLQAPPARPPEECVIRTGDAVAASVEYAGKTYEFRFADCRDEFLTDPERYSQLYDALLQMRREGVAPASAPPVSLVPS